ncbi:MAG: hypothetical protein PHW27_14400 [Melioribacteraceae bacterium]|nr:hypothetical protein [Melioribacteraceae bacterium]MDD3559754.1 hypothetical protein [Melioribacteraceae bacterium]
MIKKILSLLLLLSTFAIFHSCGEEVDKSQSPFPVDTSLVSAGYKNEELGVKLNPPKEWVLTSSEFSEKIIPRLSKTRTGYESFVYIPKVLFYNEVTKAVLNIGSFKTTTDKSNFTGGFEEYLNSIKIKYHINEYSNIEVLNNGVKINVLKIDSNNLFSYQVLFNNKSGNLIRIEYSCRNDFKNELLPLIESSIGTLTLI